MTPLLYEKTPGRPHLAPRLRIGLAELAHESRVVIVPGADDWFGETEVPCINNVEIEAKVGDATRVYLDLVMVNVTSEHGVQIAREVEPPRFRRIRRICRWLSLRLWRVSGGLHYEVSRFGTDYRQHISGLAP